MTELEQEYSYLCKYESHLAFRIRKLHEKLNRTTSRRLFVESKLHAQEGNYFAASICRELAELGKT